MQKFQLSNDPPLQEAVEKLVSDVLDQSPDVVFLGRGGSWSAYELQHDGEVYAVKISSGATHTPEATLRSAQHISTTRDTQAVEHLIAFDANHGIIIANRVPGKRLIELTPEELAAIPDAHFKKALEDIVEATKEHIKFDPKPTNFLYDAESGFGFVDIEALELDSQFSAEYLLRIEAAISGFACALQNVGVYGKAPRSDEEKMLAIDSIESGIKASNRLTDIAGSIPNVVPPTALLGIYSSTGINAGMMSRTAAGYKADVNLGPRPPAPSWAQGLD